MITLKTEAIHPAAPNVLQQQARFDTFLQRHNDVRPYQALDMKTPATVYTASTRLYSGLEINVSQVFAGQKVGVKQVDEPTWLVRFMHYDWDISTM